MSYHNDINGRNEDGLTGRWKSDEKGVGSIRWNVGFQLFRNVTNDPYKTDNVELRGWRSQSLSNVRLADNSLYFADEKNELLFLPASILFIPAFIPANAEPRIVFSNMLFT